MVTAYRYPYQCRRKRGPQRLDRARTVLGGACPVLSRHTFTVQKHLLIFASMCENSLGLWLLALPYLLHAGITTVSPD